MIELFAVSLVWRFAQAPYGSLNDIDLKRFERTVRDAIIASGAVGWAIFGIDISWNEQIQKGLGAYWQYQLYGIACVSNREAVWVKLRAALGNCVTVSKPVKFDNYDGSALGASYVYKVRFWRRISYWDARSARPCWQTAYRSLRAKHAVELALALDRIGLGGRLAIHGLEVDATGNQGQLRRPE